MTLVGLAVAISAAALLMASNAAADDPIVTIGAGADVEACVNIEHSGLIPSETTAVVTTDPCPSESTPSGADTSQSGDHSAGSPSGPATPSSPAKPASPSGRQADAAWVSASAADGLRIAGFRVLLTDVPTTKRFRVVVTLRDNDGKLVRGGIVTIDRVPGADNTVKRADTASTNQAGKAQLEAVVNPAHLGTRIVLQVAARTPTSRALQLRSVTLPASHC